MKPNYRLLYLLALVKFVLPFLLQHPAYEPHRDEFLYLAEGNHMAWGFMEVPPLLSVFAWLIHLCGDGMFWIKFWPSLFGAFTYILVGKIIISLGGRMFALFMGFLPFVAGGYLRVHYLFQPNFLEIFFWTMIAWSLVSFVQTKENRWLYVFGVSLGLGMMSKYSVAFFATSVLLALVCTKERRIYLNKHFYGAAAIAFLIFLPNLLWQYHNHFPVVFHMKELQKNQLQYVSPADFLKGQLLMSFSCVFVWITGLCWVSFAGKAKQYRFIALAYVFVIVLLLLGRGKSYYALGVYPVLFAFGAYALESFTVVKYRYLRYVFVAVPVYLGYLIAHIALPVFEPAKLADWYERKKVAKYGVLKWEDLKNHPLPQDFADMLGWSEMSNKMFAAYNKLDSNEKKNTILFCDNYGQAGAVNYYGAKQHMPEAYSDNASFLYWMPEHLEFDNLLLLTDDENEMQHDFIKNFKSATLIDSVTTPLALERGDLIILLKGPNEQFKKFLIDKMEKDRAKVKW